MTEPIGPQREGLKQNRKDLEQQLEFYGLDHYQLISLPLPSPFTFCGRAIPASYCNFLITNELVVVPSIWGR
jgi:agmatine deiminase